MINEDINTTKKPTYKVFEFSFKTLKTMTAYSICIPRVFANIRWKRVKAVFDQLQLGEIDRIDMVQRTGDDGANFQRCFIHFKTWADTENARAVRSQLDADGGEIKIVYDDPWFWKCFKSRVARPDQAPKSRQQRAPTIELEGGKIIRSAQRAGSRKVQGRRGSPQRNRKHNRGQSPKKPSSSSGGGDVAPATSVAADEFLAQLSIPADNAVADYIPTTPPGPPNTPTQESVEPTVEAASS